MHQDSLKRQPPVGTQDYLPDACRRKRHIERSLADEFERAGYDEIETPVFEYYDVFTHDSQPYVQEDIVKFFDRRGHIMALRPDVTGSIARMAATKLLQQNEVLRLFYIGNVYGIREPGEKVETTQAGVELIGASGIHADAEPIALAIQSLLDIGVENFSIELGQVEYFRGLLEGTDLPESAVDKIRELVNDKNSVELEYLLSQLPLEERIKEDLMQLPGLFLSRDMFRRVSTKNAACRQAVDNVRGVLRVLDGYGFSRFVSVDLGLLHDFHYYTGILFRGLLPGLGQPLLSGGRYDGLLQEFGRPRPAIGFAINLNRLLQVPDLAACPPAGEVIHMTFDAGEEGVAYAHAQERRRCGERVVLEGPEEGDATC